MKYTYGFEKCKRNNFFIKKFASDFLGSKICFQILE
jgi:hypothetical protein